MCPAVCRPTSRTSPSPWTAASSAKACSSTLIGLQQAYAAQFRLDDSPSAAGKATEASLKTQCVVQRLVGYPLKK